MVEQRRRDRESFEVVLRRFFREVQQSGVLTDAKSRRNRVKPISRRERRRIALRKAARKRLVRGY